MTAYDATFRLATLAGLPGASYHELAGAAHGMPIHRAAEVNALLQSHLHRVEAAT